MREMSTPPTVILPDRMSQNLAASFAAVDLPSPDGPTRAVTSPCLAVNDTSLRTSVPPSYENATWSNSMSYPSGLKSVEPPWTG